LLTKTALSSSPFAFGSKAKPSFLKFVNYRGDLSAERRLGSVRFLIIFNKDLFKLITKTYLQKSRR